MKRKRMYDITNPYGHEGRHIHITADLDTLEFLHTLDWLINVQISITQTWAMAFLSPLYDIEDAWLATVEALDEFTSRELEREPDPDVWDF